MFGARSDKGMVREINEDSFNVIAGSQGQPCTFIIADGMGGHNSGEVASKMAVDFISNYLYQTPELISLQNDASCENKISAAIQELILRANAEVFSKSQQYPENKGMGTTLIVAVMREDNLYIGHVGDSRLYLITGDHIERITTDHSFIEELIKNGSLKREEAENHPKKNLITRAIGCSSDLEVDTYECGLNKNDILVLCTDGLTNMLDEEEIKNVVLGSESLESACDELIRRANEKGGEDNITVIVAKNTETDAGER